MGKHRCSWRATKTGRQNPLVPPCACWVCMRNRAMCLATFGTASAIDGNWEGAVAIGAIYGTITSDRRVPGYGLHGVLRVLLSTDEKVREIAGCPIRAPMFQRMTKASRRLRSSERVSHQRRGRTLFGHQDPLQRWSRWCRRGSWSCTRASRTCQQWGLDAVGRVQCI